MRHDDLESQLVQIVSILPMPPRGSKPGLLRFLRLSGASRQLCLVRADNCVWCEPTIVRGVRLLNGGTFR